MLPSQNVGESRIEINLVVVDVVIEFFCAKDLSNPDQLHMDKQSHVIKAVSQTQYVTALHNLRVVMDYVVRVYPYGCYNNRIQFTRTKDTEN